MKVEIDYRYIEGCESYFLTMDIWNNKMDISKHNFFKYKIDTYDLTSRYYKNGAYRKDFNKNIKPYLDKKFFYIMVNELARYQLYIEFLHAFNCIGRKIEELDAIEFIINESGYDMDVVFDEDMKELTEILCSLIKNKFLQFRQVIYKHNKIKITEE